jgi:hypothetical protein
MFERALDVEHTFGHHDDMSRTRVRRRRLSTALVGVALAIALSAPVAAALGRHPEPHAGKVLPIQRWEQVYVVRPGDTVWSVAESAAGGADPRPWVDAIAARNAIEPGAVVPGQALIIPRSA